MIDLQLQLKQAHWNVKGPHYIGLHELFDKIAEEVESYVDEIAERIVQLGGIAQGTIRVAASPVPARRISTDDCRWVGPRCSRGEGALDFRKRGRALGIDEVNALGDADTADLFTEVSPKGSTSGSCLSKPTHRRPNRQVRI